VRSIKKAKKQAGWKADLRLLISGDVPPEHFISHLRERDDKLSVDLTKYVENGKFLLAYLGTALKNAPRGCAV